MNMLLDCHKDWTILPYILTVCVTNMTLLWYIMDTLSFIIGLTVMCISLGILHISAVRVLPFWHHQWFLLVKRRFRGMDLFVNRFLDIQIVDDVDRFYYQDMRLYVQEKWKVIRLLVSSIPVNTLPLSSAHLGLSLSYYYQDQKITVAHLYIGVLVFYGLIPVLTCTHSIFLSVRTTRNVFKKLVTYLQTPEPIPLVTHIKADHTNCCIWNKDVIVKRGEICVVTGATKKDVIVWVHQRLGWTYSTTYTNNPCAVNDTETSPQTVDYTIRPYIYIQSSHFFHMSVKENIILDHPYDQNRWNESVQLAGLDTVWFQLENGLDTVMCESMDPVLIK